MKTMRENLSLTLERLRLEASKLEGEELVMREQEGKLRDSYKHLQDSQGRYRTKGEFITVDCLTTNLMELQFKPCSTRPRAS